MRVARFGGNWNNGDQAGLSNWNLNNTSTNTNVNNGGQTLIGKQHHLLAFILPHRLVEIRPKRAWASNIIERP